MESFEPAMAPRFRGLLEQRAARLREILRHEADAVGPDAAHEVQDFKDIATGDSTAAVDEVQAGHAAHELIQVDEAMRRLADGSYGQCTDCAEPIDLRRLVALPASTLCTACQARREHGHAGR
ncbi:MULTISPECIES: TraR/DksA family transcriptional regulator [Ramlibacter]|uniref:TraR/DksA family transcriptional regulator n=1 Tax=Ramlibacter aquaticus TaxID=2780094 RepID=A0ABR9SBD9_9BURK|nr:MULTISPECIES: TraR/DksA family transcriptional regulator [Ramlibacter]MBE7939658.1 TraR/DksA family transcriptional regulator [Ramlibacter aquaticus]